LFHALADIAQDSPVRLTVMTPAAAAPAIAAATVPSATALTSFTRAGLLTPNNPQDLARVLAALATTPQELMATIQLDSTLSAALIANDANAVTTLTALVTSFKARELIAAIPLVSGANVLLVVAVTQLPSSVALNARQPAIRWYALPIKGKEGG